MKLFKIDGDKRILLSEFKPILPYHSMLTPESVTMLTDRIGYRNDKCYGGNVDSFLEVMKYETYKLGNADIFLTCNKLYNMNLDISKEKECIEKVYSYFSRHFKSEEIYCIWLALKHSVYRLYDGEENCDMYKINDDSLVASELGMDGTLFISTDKFRKIIG